MTTTCTTQATDAIGIKRLIARAAATVIGAGLTFLVLAVTLDGATKALVI